MHRYIQNVTYTHAAVTPNKLTSPACERCTIVLIKVLLPASRKTMQRCDCSFNSAPHAQASLGLTYTSLTYTSFTRPHTSLSLNCTSLTRPHLHKPQPQLHKPHSASLAQASASTAQSSPPAHTQTALPSWLHKCLWPGCQHPPPGMHRISPVRTSVIVKV